MENNTPNIFDKYKALTKGQKIFLVLGIVFLIGWLFPDKGKHRNSSSSNSGSENCIGDEGCISKVRENFSATGKTIMGEEYLGNGRFGITFLDTQHPGEAYNAKVYTDCDCNVVDVNVSTAR